MGLYDQIRILQHKGALQAIESGMGADLPPIHVRIEPTEACNVKCDFCIFHGQERSASIEGLIDFTGKRRLELSRFLTLIDEFAEMGVKAISFTGAGDPMVYPDIGAVLKRIREHGISAGMTSNLAMPVKDDAVEELAQVKWIRWSMNAGTEEIHARIYAIRQSDAAKVFARVQENVKRINAARSKVSNPSTINASFVVSTMNRGDVLAGAYLAHSLGVDSVAFRPDTSFDRKDDAQSYAYVAAVQADIARARSELENKGFKIHVGEERLEDVKRRGDPDLVCFYANHSTFIASNGDVYPCCYTRHDKSYAVGNILNQSFQSFWSSEKRRQHYKSLQYDVCPSCPYGETNKVLQSLYQKSGSADALYVENVVPDNFV